MNNSRTASKFLKTVKRETISEFIGSPAASIISALTAIILGISYSIWAAHQRDEKHVVEIGVSIIVGLNFYTATELFLRVFVLRGIKERLRKIDKASRKALEHTRSYSALSNNLLTLSQSDQLLYQIGLSAVNNFTNNFAASEQRREMSLTGRDLTIESFKKFWNELIRLQDEQGSGQPISVYVTHVDDIDLYRTDPISLDLQYQQKAFVNKGGQVYRILVETPEKEKDRRISHYVEVLQQMSDAKIVVSYINPCHTENGFPRGISHDILIVPTLGYSFEWQKNTGAILGCCISRDETNFEKHKGTWNNLVAQLKVADYAKDACTSDHLQYLNDIKSKFFKSYAAP